MSAIASSPAAGVPVIFAVTRATSKRIDDAMERHGISKQVLMTQAIEWYLRVTPAAEANAEENTLP